MDIQKMKKLFPPLFEGEKNLLKILVTHMQNQHSYPHGKQIVNAKLYQVSYVWKDLNDAILMLSCPLNLELKCRSYGHLKNEKLSPPLFDSRKESFKILMTYMQNQHSSPHGKCLFVLILSIFLIPWQIKGPPKTSLSP